MSENSENVTLEPMYDRVVCEPIKEEKSEGGLFIPQTAQGKDVRKCTVVAVGQGKRHMDTGEFFGLTLKPGDMVIVDPMKASAVKVARNAEFLVTREEDVVGRLITNN